MIFLPNLNAIESLSAWHEGFDYFVSIMSEVKGKWVKGDSANLDRNFNLICQTSQSWQNIVIKFHMQFGYYETLYPAK